MYLPRVLPRECRSDSDFSAVNCKMLVQRKTSLFVPVAYPLCTIVARGTPRDSLLRQDVARKAVGHRGIR